jgi:hypothetical protein
MTATEEAERIAIHECAHAVLYHCFKFPVSSVEIRGDTGCCVAPPVWQVVLSNNQIGNLAKREGLMRLIIAGCAGKAAMDKWYGYKAKSDENWRASNDYKQAFNYALQINNGDHEGATLLIRWLSRRAEVLVKRHWSQINALASELLERSKLSGAEIHKIIDGDGGASLPAANSGCSETSLSNSICAARSQGAGLGYDQGPICGAMNLS